MPQQLPKTMQAATIHAFGGPNSLKMQTLPVPDITADEVLIKVAAAGVGSWDATEREGNYDGVFGIPSTFPYTLGWDGAGVVAAVGVNVHQFKEGDVVYAASTPLPKGGFYAEYKAVAVENVALAPRKLSIEQAAAMPWCALTALSGLDQLDLKEGETVMVFGASGGIGHIAVQLAKRMGAKVLAVASGKDGVALATQLGADMAIDGLQEDVMVAARQFAPDGIDAALVTMGGKAVDVALQAVCDGGRVACPYGVQPEPNTKQSVELRMYNGAHDSRATARLNSLIESGPFTVYIDRTFPLEQTAAAHRALTSHYIGKIILKVA